MLVRAQRIEWMFDVRYVYITLRAPATPRRHIPGRAAAHPADENMDVGGGGGEHAMALEGALHNNAE